MKKVCLALAASAATVLCVVFAVAATAQGPAELKTHSNKLGTFLVAGNGKTLYLFEADKGHTSTCNGDCATDWPPLLTGGKAAVKSGAKSSLVGTTRRADGRMQVTYDGHPLYEFVGDQKAGATKGEGSKQFGAGWYVVRPSGHKIDDDDGDKGGDDSR
jgi:predicted lipoprotein with Yx(FWY)xxD motif